MTRLCIIPARGGSKRIPRKNIKDFLGKPIISYPIECAQKSGLFDEVMVSTDDREIASIALEFGAKVPFMRSLENANDYAGTFEVIEEVITRYKEEGKEFAQACCIYPTAPLLTVDKIKEGLELLIKEDFTSVFPVVDFGYPILRSLKLDKQKKVVMNWPEYQQSRSQDLPTVYHDAGQFYWFNTQAIMKAKQLFSGNSGAIILNQIEVQDIDNLVDWQLAELKYRQIND